MKSKVAWVILCENEKVTEAEVTKIESDLNEILKNHKGLRYEDAYEF